MKLWNKKKRLNECVDCVGMKRQATTEQGKFWNLKKYQAKKKRRRREENEEKSIKEIEKSPERWERSTHIFFCRYFSPFP
jgi:hypothetical protein